MTLKMMQAVCPCMLHSALRPASRPALPAAATWQICLLQLCMMAAVAASLRGEQVAYVDTGASFSGRRAAMCYQSLHTGVQVQPFPKLNARHCEHASHSYLASYMAYTPWHDQQAAFLELCLACRGSPAEWLPPWVCYHTACHDVHCCAKLPVSASLSMLHCQAGTVVRAHTLCNAGGRISEQNAAANTSVPSSHSASAAHYPGSSVCDA